MTRRGRLLVALAVVAVLLFVVAVALGPVTVPLPDTVRVLVGATPSDPRWTAVIGSFRLARAVTAGLVGAALGVAGLLMQTLFRNALADPYVLGVSAGASLGVALFLAASTAAAVGGVAAAGFGAGLVGLGRLGAVGSAAAGAVAVMLVVTVLARRTRSAVTLLVVGVMVGAVTSAVVSLVLVWTDPRSAQQYLVWTLGSVDATSPADLPLLAGTVAAGLVLAGLLATRLTVLLLGEGYARSMGVDVRTVRLVVIAAAALLAGGTTAFCGPIAFVGIAIPHLARALVRTADHRVLLPATALVGAVTVLVCTIVSHPPGVATVVPLNVVTSLVGAPVVIAVLVRARRVDGGAT